MERHTMLIVTRINTLEMIVVLKYIHRFNTTPITIYISFFTEKKYPKFVQKYTHTYTHELENENPKETRTIMDQFLL